MKILPSLTEVNTQCASGCVVECRICNREEVAGSNLSRGHFAPRSTQPSILPGSINEYQLRRLKLFGHTARAAASEDHSRALRASTDRLPVGWRRPRGRPRQSWLRTIDSDLKPLNLGLHSALRRATDRPSWRRIVETAILFERATR